MSPFIKVAAAPSQDMWPKVLEDGLKLGSEDTSHHTIMRIHHRIFRARNLNEC
jgi:hypothetical protein